MTVGDTCKRVVENEATSEWAVEKLRTVKPLTRQAAGKRQADPRGALTYRENVA